MNYKHITINERCCIANFLDLGWSLRKIAKHLNRNVSTISREVKRNSTNGKYLAHIACENYTKNRKNCGAKGKSDNFALIKYIEDGLEKTWSPEQIAGRLRLDYHDDKSMKIGFKTIYRWIYQDIISKGNVKRLRRKGKSLKPKETRGKFNIGKSIKDRPKEVRKRETIGHWEQMLTLFQKLQGDPYEYIYKLTAIYGLRRSEVCGLRWSAINFENDTITLDHAVVQCEVDGKRVLVTKDKMKNQSSMRTLPLLPAVKDILLNLKREQQERAEKYGQYYNRLYRDYVCVDEVGKLIRPDTLTTHFKSFLVRNNLPVIRFHELRHSCASILIASGVSMKAVQEWLGHSTFSTTADIYSHLNFSSKLGIADTLSDILAGNTTLKRQTAPDTIETMQKIFSTAEIEKPANENHL